MERCPEHTKCMERITAVEESIKSAHHRIDEVQENQKVLLEMNANIKLLTEQFKTQSKELTEVKSDVKELKEKPVKRWDSIVATIITVITSALSGAVLALILK